MEINKVEEEYEYTQLKDDTWDTNEHFDHFTKYSDDPQATYIRGVTTEEGVQESWEKLVPKHYHQHGMVFSQKASERMPTRKPYDHAIEILPESELPKPSKLYPLNPQERSSLDEWIKEELAKGYICPSKAPTAAPVFFVKKKDGKLRLVQDYRKLNAVTKKNKFPIPRISDMIDRLSQSSIFTSLDL